MTDRGPATTFFVRQHGREDFIAEMPTMGAAKELAERHARESPGVWLVIRKRGRLSQVVYRTKETTDD